MFNILILDIIMIVAFILIVVLAILLFILSHKVKEINDRVDSLFNYYHIVDASVAYHDERLSYQFGSIAKLNKKINNLECKVIEHNNGVDTDFFVEQHEEKDTVQARRERFAKYRKQGMDIESAGIAVGVSYSTAKRYEKWMKENKK